MSLHTQGPWETRVGAADQVFAAGGSRICTVMPKHDEPHRAYDEDVANAHLIAAAPDLLEALRMIRDADDDAIRDGEPRTIPAVARAAIDAAIAKAVQA